MIDLTGQRFGRWVVLREAPRRPAPKGKSVIWWIVKCDCGVIAERRGGALRRGQSRSCGCYARDVAREMGKARTGEACIWWTGDNVTYAGMHQRVRKVRGPASEHPCADCHLAAAHWSYVKGCPDERSDENLALTYCAHPEHYAPRCVPCHSIYDSETRIGGARYRQKMEGAELAQRDNDSVAL